MNVYGALPLPKRERPSLEAGNPRTPHFSYMVCRRRRHTMKTNRVVLDYWRGNRSNMQLYCRVYWISISMRLHFQELFKFCLTCSKVSESFALAVQYESIAPQFHISFWISPCTCLGLLNISFSPALYIFLEITFSLFASILQARSKKCQRDALGPGALHDRPGMEEFA